MHQIKAVFGEINFSGALGVNPLQECMSGQQDRYSALYNSTSYNLRQALAN